MVCSSLVELCLSYIAKHIEKWTCIITDFHIKESQYLITDMSRLPQDLVARLINQLVVCKKLSLQSLVLFLDDQLQRIELPSTLTLVTDLFLKVIARLSKNLVSLKLGSCTKLQQIDGLTQLSSLQQLDLINCKANRLDDTLQQVFQQCQLTTLNLQNTPASDKSLSVLATHCSTLLDLNLSQTSVTSLCLSTIISSSTNLRRLNLEGCFYVGNEAFDDLSTETNTELQELNLAMCDLNDNSISKIVARFIDLKALFLQGCPITDLSMKSIARSLSQLNILRLNNVTEITDRGIIALARAKTPIRMLDLSFHNITDKGLEAIAQNCVDITKLILDDCVNITDRGLVAIASNCPNLRILSVVRCSNISDAGVGPIITSCNKLQNILLDTLPISRVTVSTLSKSYTLQFVSLASCPQIKMGTELATLCKRVKTINLNNCSRITIQDYKQLQGLAKSTQVIWK